MTEEQAVALMEELSNKLGALENYVLKHSPSVWLRWQRNRDEITAEWLIKLLDLRLSGFDDALVRREMARRK